MAGKVASNEAVSTWTGSYRPYYASSGGGGGGGGSSGGRGAGAVNRPGNSGGGGSSGISIEGLYAAIEQQRLAAFEAARAANQQALQQQQAQIDAQYVASAQQAQVNARLSAIGNEEKLAALGLSAGSRYDAPTSGYTESARVNMDNALRNNLNSLAASRDNAKAQARSVMDAANTALLTQDAQAASQAALQLAQVAATQYNADREYLLQQQNAERDWALSSAAITGYLGGYPTLATRQYQTSLSQAAAEQAAAQAAQAAESQNNAYSNALTRWKTYGYVLPADAAILGVPAGTGTSDQRYRDAQNRLAELRLRR